MSLILCMCGCGNQLDDYDKWHPYKKKRFIRGHVQRGRHRSEKTKLKMSENRADFSGENNPFYGKHHSKKSLLKMRDAKLDKYCGDKSPSWKGGPIASKKRRAIKRRDLGFILINEPLHIDDEVAHHLTIDYVAYVPEYINKSSYHNIHTGKNMDEVNFYTLNYLFLVYNKEES